MKIQSVEIDMEAFGAEFANKDSKDQAAFFKGLARELMTWKSRHSAQMQFAFVGNDLKDDEKEMLEYAVEQAWYKESK